MVFEKIGLAMGINVDNYAVFEKKEAEHKLRQYAPLVLPEDEHVILAYKLRNHKIYFTDRRILTKKSSKFDKEAPDYVSLPYSDVAGYSCTSAGTLDADWELEIYFTCFDKFSMLQKDMLADVPLQELLYHLNVYCLPHVDPFGTEDKVGAAISTKPPQEDKQGVLDYLGDNAKEIDPQQAEQKLKSYLHPNEKVRIAYKSGRDLTLFTTKRVFIIDTKGVSGKRIEYLSILYRNIRAFALETAPTKSWMDRDAELILFTNIPNLPKYEQDLNRNCNIFKLHNFLTDVLCGVGPGMLSPEANYQDMGGGDHFKGVPGWLAGEGNAGQISAQEANHIFHNEPHRILQDEEHVEMAFKGRKDYFLLTTKRAILVDNKKSGIFGSGGTKTMYYTMPYFSMSHFAVQTPSTFDRDSELFLWLDSCDFYYEQQEENEPPVPIPGSCFFTIDLAKDKVDLLAVHRYMSDKLLGLPQYPYQLPKRQAETRMAQNSHPYQGKLMNNLIAWITGDAHLIDPNQMNQWCHQNGFLMVDEYVCIAYNSGRDLLLFTSKRIFYVDIKGMSGKKQKYFSFPYANIQSFGVRSANKFDMDCEFYFYPKAFWNSLDEPEEPSDLASVVSVDLARGGCDIMAIFNFMSERCLLHDCGMAFTQEIPQIMYTQPAGMEKFLNFFDRDNAEMLSAQMCMQLTQEFKSSLPLLLATEQIEMGFKVKKDFMLFTNFRFINIDEKKVLKGLFGKKIAYNSLAWRHVVGFRFESAGSFGDSDAELHLYTTVSDDPHLKFDIKKGKLDLKAINTWLTGKLINTRRYHNMGQSK